MWFHSVGYIFNRASVTLRPTCCWLTTNILVILKASSPYSNTAIFCSLQNCKRASHYRWIVFLRSVMCTCTRGGFTGAARQTRLARHFSASDDNFSVEAFTSSLCGLKRGEPSHLPYMVIDTVRQARSHFLLHLDLSIRSRNCECNCWPSEAVIYNMS